MTWLKQNILQLLAIVLSAFALYLGVADRLTILEQKAYANDKEHQSISDNLENFKKDLNNRLDSIQNQINGVDAKTTDIYKIMLNNKEK